MGEGFCDVTEISRRECLGRKCSAGTGCKALFISWVEPCYDDQASRRFHSELTPSPTLFIHACPMFVLPKNDDNPKYTYSRVYEEILQTRRKFKDSSVVMLVPPEPDALCGARILSTLFAREDVRLNIIPVAGYPSLQEEKEILLKSGGVSVVDQSLFTARAERKVHPPPKSSTIYFL